MLRWKRIIVVALEVQQRPISAPLRNDRIVAKTQGRVAAEWNEPRLSVEGKRDDSC